MPTYRIDIESTRIPATRVTAPDVYALGERIAEHLTRHKALRVGVTYDIALDETGGQIDQAGIHRPINFTIRKDG